MRNLSNEINIVLNKYQYNNGDNISFADILIFIVNNYCITNDNENAVCEVLDDLIEAWLENDYIKLKDKDE